MDRERQAWDELRRSQSTRSARSVLLVSFFLVVVGVFLGDLTNPYGFRDAVRLFFDRMRPLQTEPNPAYYRTVLAWNREMIADGEAFEGQLVDESILQQTVGPWQWVLYRAFGMSGTQRVLIGQDQWMFLRENVLMALGMYQESNWREAEFAVRELAGVLEEKGIRLVLLPIPSKPAVQPGRFDPDAENLYPLPVSAALTALLQRVEAIPNVSVFPIQEKLRERTRAGVDSFLERDTHWTPAAMAEIADHLVEEMPQAHSVSDRPPISERKVTGEGDLARMMRLPGRSPFPLQEVYIQEGRAEDRPEGNPRILVLGDSFSAVFADPSLGWGEGLSFVSLLERSLGVPVASFLNYGDPALGPRQQLKRALQAGDSSVADVEVVIWQFADRFLNEGDWRPLFEEAAP